MTHEAEAHGRLDRLGREVERPELVVDRAPGRQHGDERTPDRCRRRVFANVRVGTLVVGDRPPDARGASDTGEHDRDRRG